MSEFTEEMLNVYLIIGFTGLGILAILFAYISAVRGRAKTSIVSVIISFALLGASLYCLNDASFKQKRESLLEPTKTNQVLKKPLRENNISMLENKEKPLQIEDRTFENMINRYLDGTYLIGSNCPEGVTFSINAGSCMVFNSLSAKEYDSGFQLDINISKTIDSESIEDYCIDKTKIRFTLDDRLIDKKYALLGCEDRVLAEAIKKTDMYRIKSFGGAYKKYKLFKVN